MRPPEELVQQCASRFDNTAWSQAWESHLERIYGYLNRLQNATTPWDLGLLSILDRFGDHLIGKYKFFEALVAWRTAGTQPPSEGKEVLDLVEAAWRERTGCKEEAMSDTVDVRTARKNWEERLALASIERTNRKRKTVDHTNRANEGKRRKGNACEECKRKKQKCKCEGQAALPVESTPQKEDSSLGPSPHRQRRMIPSEKPSNSRCTLETGVHTYNEPLPSIPNVPREHPPSIFKPVVASPSQGTSHTKYNTTPEITPYDTIEEPPPPYYAADTGRTQGPDNSGQAYTEKPSAHVADDQYEMGPDTVCCLGMLATEQGFDDDGPQVMAVKMLPDTTTIQPSRQSDARGHLQGDFQIDGKTMGVDTGNPFLIPAGAEDEGLSDDEEVFTVNRVVYHSTASGETLYCVIWEDYFDPCDWTWEPESVLSGTDALQHYFATIGGRPGVGLRNQNRLRWDVPVKFTV
ncbi:hypothetical protein BDV96DRAFT_607730 [Lophiotrema nucula]|uniref:Chromo domain-containing protein n=1 Tax=Lophiotrema nucula TaxID=690887 RepID=A0A6A5YIW5_9PLEO|nr:hypothetical protein BDV96DRAFT_607730 [Lophiotrema nucula]